MNLLGIATPNKINSSSADPVLRLWDGHDLTKVGNYARTVNILKGRWGIVNVHTTLFNAGRCGAFFKFPALGTTEYRNFIDNIKQFK